MCNTITTKLDPIDWVGCVPVIGTAVGLIESVYYLGLHIFSYIEQQKNLKILQKITKSSDFGNNLATMLSGAGVRRMKEADVLEGMKKTISDEADRFDEPAAEQTFDDFMKIARMQGKKLQEAERMLIISRNITVRNINELQRAVDKRNQLNERMDVIARKLCKALLRTTWFGAIGICVYKIYKVVPVLAPVPAQS